MSPFLGGLLVVVIYNVLFYVLVARRFERETRLAVISLGNAALSVFGLLMSQYCRAHGGWLC